jgi:hypothetical protein
LLPLKSIQHSIELALPQRQSFPSHAVVNEITIALGRHETGISQDLEMLGNRTLAHAQLTGECTDTQIALRKQRQHPKPRFDGQDPQLLRRFFD